MRSPRLAAARRRPPRRSVRTRRGARLFEQGRDGGNGADCATVAVLDVARGPGVGKTNLQMACQRGEEFACELVKKVP